MAWKAGKSGNPKGRKPGGLNKLTAQICTMADGAMPKVIEDLIEQTKAGDRESRALFLKVFKPPTPRLVTTPIEIPAAKNADEALRPDRPIGVAGRRRAVRHRRPADAGRGLAHIDRRSGAGA